MKAKKLPSGNYRVQIYAGKDENGKRLRKSFTADTAKEAIRQAVFYETEQKVAAIERDDPTVKAALKMYIDSRENVVSPSTVKGYRASANHDFEMLNGYRVSAITPLIVQNWIGAFSVEHSPKTVKNAYSLLSASLKAVRTWDSSCVSLPKKKKVQYHVVTDKEFQTVFDHCKGTKLGIAIALAAYIPARRSEICALTNEDIDRKNNTITINKAMVQTDVGDWVIKQPKSYAGYRTVPMPKEIIAMIPNEPGRIMDCNPDALYNRFDRAMKVCKMRGLFRFHDLRHYGASWMHSRNVPTKTIQMRGGWESVSVLENIYEHSMEASEKAAVKIIGRQFSKQFS